MPTVLRMGGLRVVIYPNDHRPAHVHLKGDGREAVFDLYCPDGPTELRQNFGFALRDLSRIKRTLDDEVESLCDEWRNIHG
jgi:hypothetical protein